MSAPRTIVVLDPNPQSQALRLLDAPDRVVVLVSSPTLARHALSTMVTAVWVCDLGTARTDFSALVSIARLASPNVRVVFTGAPAMEGRARALLSQTGVAGSFTPRPWTGLSLLKAVSDELAAALRAEFSGADAEPAAAPSGTGPHRAGRKVLVVHGLGGSSMKARSLSRRIAETASPRIGPPSFRGPDPNAWELLDILGKGGTGTVYRARDKFLEIDVAIKVVHHELLADAGVMAAFKDEARITMQLSHRNILRIYSFQVHNGCHYIVMELVHGRTLRQILSECGALSVPCTCRIVRQIADALEYAHAHNVVHKDMKPDNCTITDDGVAKVLDFGSATLNDELSRRENIVVGTPQYMAPEQLRGDLATPATDIHALGVMSYRMLLGCLPYPEGTTTQDILDGARPDVSALPEPVRGVVARAVADDPAARWSSAPEFSRALSEACGCTELAADPYAPIEMEPAAVSDAGAESGPGA